MTHRILGAVVIVLAVAGSPVFAGGSDPEIVLDEIFGQVDAMCGGDGRGAAYDMRAIAADYFTPDLKATLEKGLDSGALGFDVLVDAQDCKTTDLAVEVVKSEADAAVGRATFKNMGEDRVIDLVMTRSGGDWSVEDIIYRHRTFSLRAGE